MSADRDKARPSPESGIRRAHESEKARRLDVAAGVDRVRRYFQHASRDRHTRRMDHHRNGPSFDLLTDDRNSCIGCDVRNAGYHHIIVTLGQLLQFVRVSADGYDDKTGRSEEHTSELQSLMRISYAVFSLKKQ